MAEIKRIYRQTLPDMKLIGRCYGENDRRGGTFADKWESWFRNDLFAPLAQYGGDEPFADCDAYIGLCRCKEGEPFQYWIGVFAPAGAAVPDGYDSVPFAAGDVAVCWVYGKEPDIYAHCCLDELKKHGYAWASEADGFRCCFERYVRPRFTEPDAMGNVILDMCYRVCDENKENSQRVV